MKELLNRRILIVDDEKALLAMMEETLRDEGFAYIYTAETCEQALDIVRRQNIALCLLDVNLPDGNGFDLFEDMRRIVALPVIFLTARSEDSDKIYGLGLGADDYVTKPFLRKELILRIMAVLRRTYSINPPPAGFRLSDRTVNFETASVQLANEEIHLTAKEFILLKKLWENKNRIVTGDALCMAAWGDEYYGYENTLMVHIRRLREKIEQNPSRPRHLLTAKGIGYKLVIDDE